MYVDSCLFWEGTVLLSNSLIPQIREILDFSARSADASFGFKLEFKKHTSNPKMQLRTRGGFLNLKSKLHLSFTHVPHAVH